MIDALKLTTYFGERVRVGDRFLADALLDVYGRRELALSVLLRGAVGFGRKHHLRTDRLLTLSEDLPLVAVAVDTRERIEAALPDVLALRRDGLVTLERARLVTGALDAITPAEPTKLTVYVGRQERVDGVPAFAAVTELLHQRGVAGATVLLGVDGTAHGVRRRARFFARNAEVPVMIIAVGESEPIAAVLPELERMLARPLLTLERVRVCKRDGERLATPHGGKLMVYWSEQARHQELVRRLRAEGASGVTTLRGIWGFHGDHAPHGDRLVAVRRHVPTVTTIVESPERLATAFAIVDELTQDRGLVTSELVPDVRIAGSA